MDDHTTLDLSRATVDVMTLVMKHMSLSDRFTCALVCKTWAEAATAATHSIILEHRLRDFACLQRWIQKHGSQLEVLQLHDCDGAALSALPCAKLQDLLLHGTAAISPHWSISSSVWSDIAAATRLTSVSLAYVYTATKQQELVSALTALPDLERLTWCYVECLCTSGLSDSALLQQLTRLTALELQGDTTVEALQHLGSLTKLQHLKLDVPWKWANKNYPGLQELKALTSLHLRYNPDDISASVSQLTALQQLHVRDATHDTLMGLQVLTGLTQLCVQQLKGLSLESAPLPFPALQHLDLQGGLDVPLPLSITCRCTRLQVLELQEFDLTAPGSLVYSSMLQKLLLHRCFAADGASSAAPWEHIFPGPGPGPRTLARRLPHLTSLQLSAVHPAPDEADMRRIVACNSNLQELQIDGLGGGICAALQQLPGLTTLSLERLSDRHCSSLAQLTGLRALRVRDPDNLAMDGLRQLTALEQLTSLGFVKHLNPVKVPMAPYQMSATLPGCHCAIVNKVSRW